MNDPARFLLALTLSALALTACVWAQESGGRRSQKPPYEALSEEWIRQRDETRPEVERTLLAQLESFAELEHHPEPQRGVVLWLTRSSNATLRLAAYRALQRFRPEEVPLRELFAVIQDPAVVDDERVAALHAWARGPHPEVYVRLHVLARNVDHPGWHVVMERLGELGDRFTLERLSHVGLELDEERSTMHRRTIERIRAELPAREGARHVRAVLERAAWADLACHPLEVEFVPWMRETVTAWTRNEDAVLELLDLYNHYEPAPEVLSPVLGGSLRSRVRTYARTLLPD